MYKSTISILGFILCLHLNASAQTDLCDSLNLAKGITSKARQLNFVSDVKCQILNLDQIRKKTQQNFFREISAEQIKYEEMVYKALQIIPTNYDYKNEIIKIYSSTAAGLYETNEKTLYLVKDLAAEEYPVTIVHELTHALQDQHFNMLQLKSMRATSDQIMAISALLEGDASSVEDISDSKLQNQLLNFYQKVIKNNKSIQSEQENIQNQSTPPALKKLLSFSYDFGFNFVKNLQKQSGQSTTPQRAFTRPPQSTSEILHLAKFLAEKELPRMPEVELPENVLIENIKLVFSDRMGEYFINAMLANKLATKSAILASNAWENDRLLLYQNKDSNKFLILWDISVASEEKAQFLKLALDDFITKIDQQNYQWSVKINHKFVQARIML